MAITPNVTKEIQIIHNDLNRFTALKKNITSEEVYIIESCKKLVVDFQNNNGETSFNEKAKDLKEAMNKVLRGLIIYENKGLLDAKRAPEVDPLVEIYEMMVDIMLKMEDARKKGPTHPQGTSTISQES